MVTHKITPETRTLRISTITVDSGRSCSLQNFVPPSIEIYKLSLMLICNVNEDVSGLGLLNIRSFPCRTFSALETVEDPTGSRVRIPTEQLPVDVAHNQVTVNIDQASATRRTAFPATAAEPQS